MKVDAQWEAKARSQARIQSYKNPLQTSLVLEPSMIEEDVETEHDEGPSEQVGMDMDDTM